MRKESRRADVCARYGAMAASNLKPRLVLSALQPTACRAQCIWLAAIGRGRLVSVQRIDSRFADSSRRATHDQIAQVSIVYRAARLRRARCLNRSISASMSSTRVGWSNPCGGRCIVGRAPPVNTLGCFSPLSETVLAMSGTPSFNVLPRSFTPLNHKRCLHANLRWTKNHPDFGNTSAPPMI